MPNVSFETICPRAHAAKASPATRTHIAISDVSATQHFVSQSTPSKNCIGHFTFDHLKNHSAIYDEPEINRNPCIPSPCGPNSLCRAINNQAVCTCAESYIGQAPNCRPECVLSSECPFDKSCERQKCVNPCITACGINAECRVHNHSPICTCKVNFIGDPFTRCYPQPRKFK